MLPHRQEGYCGKPLSSAAIKGNGHRMLKTKDKEQPEP